MKRRKRSRESENNLVSFVRENNNFSHSKQNPMKFVFFGTILFGLENKLIFISKDSNTHTHKCQRVFRMNRYDAIEKGEII